MRFKCDVKAIDVDLSNFPMEMAETVDGEPEMAHSDAVVRFSVELETREWGVKDILTHVSMVEVSVGEHELCIKQFEPCTINGVNDDQWEIIEYIDLYSPEKLSISPSEIGLDWKTKKAYVNF
jgi:hypothetical protein